jgi:hypothetical protein
MGCTCKPLRYERGVLGDPNLCTEAPPILWRRRPLCPTSDACPLLLSLHSLSAHHPAFIYVSVQGLLSLADSLESGPIAALQEAVGAEQRAALLLEEYHTARAAYGSSLRKTLTAKKMAKGSIGELQGDQRRFDQAARALLADLRRLETQRREELSEAWAGHVRGLEGTYRGGGVEGVGKEREGGEGAGAGGEEGGEEGV